MLDTLRRIFSVSSEISGKPGSQGHWLRASVHSRREIQHVVEDVADAVAGEGFPGRDVVGACSAVREALLNAMATGQRGNSTKEVRLICHITSDKVMAEVQTQGDAFNPDDTLLADNAGSSRQRDLVLIRHYANGDQRHGNHMIVVKRSTRQHPLV